MKYLFPLFFLCLILKSNAQSGQSLQFGKNAVYAEWYGNGIYYSLNYERILYSKDNNRLHMAGRIGSMVYQNVFSKGNYIFIFPLELNALVGKSEHKMELGIGNSISSAKFYYWASDPQRYYRQFILFTRLGYRYFAKGGIVCRIAALPLIIYKLGYIPPNDEPDFGLLRPSTSGLINDNSFKRFSLGISAGLSFGYSF